MNTYHPNVLERLAAFGAFPRPHTQPAVPRDFLKALYTMEIRMLRTAQQGLERAGKSSGRGDYVDRILQLREKYEVLSLPIELWTI